jgi:hypothetical protein
MWKLLPKLEKFVITMPSSGDAGCYEPTHMFCRAKQGGGYLRSPVAA